jgi:prepilin-type N-terminal cleavage/methylation domain-containing protein
MTHRAPRTAQRGFTLIELMIAVAIIGILASVAIPNYQKFMLRAKTGERLVVMNRIKQQVQDYYLRNGTSIDPVAHPSTTTLMAGWNPEYPPVAQKRMMDSTVGGKPIWAEYFSGTATRGSAGQEIEGPLYYAYYFMVVESPLLSQVQVWAYGDLDADGSYSQKTILWNRQNGIYNIAAEVPAAGMEDDNDPASLTF